VLRGPRGRSVGRGITLISCALVGLVICPGYGVAEDDVALKTLQRLLPRATVVSLECTEVAKRAAFWNCVSWTCQLT